MRCHFDFNYKPENVLDLNLVIDRVSGVVELSCSIFLISFLFGRIHVVGN